MVELLEASKLQRRNATKPRVNTIWGVPLVGKGKPSLGVHKAKHPPGRALTQCGTTQRPARWRVSNHRGNGSGPEPEPTWPTLLSPLATTCWPPLRAV